MKYVLGWGQTKRDGPVEPSHQLMKVNAPIVVDDYCEKKVLLFSLTLRSTVVS